MSSGKKTGVISGAAGGAATGAIFGPWGAAIGGVLGGIGGLISGGAADAQQKNQSAWAEYNNKMQYQTNIYNINSSLNIANMNAAAIMASANINSKLIEQSAVYNASMIEATTLYNNSLLEQELTRVWQDEELDLEQLEIFRSRERGTIVAEQAASGTVIGEGSNADVIVSQQTQEAMDATIIMFNADRTAADINNQMAQSTWQGQTAISQTMWEGQIQSFATTANAAIQSSGTLATARIQASGDRWSATQAFQSGADNIAKNNWQFNQANTQNMVAGLFSAAGTAVSAYYVNKVPVRIAKSAGNATSATNFKYMGSRRSTANLARNSLRSPGSSLLGPNV